MSDELTAAVKTLADPQRTYHAEHAALLVIKAEYDRERDRTPITAALLVKRFDGMLAGDVCELGYDAFVAIRPNRYRFVSQIISTDVRTLGDVATLLRMAQTNGVE